MTKSVLVAFVAAVLVAPLEWAEAKEKQAGQQWKLHVPRVTLEELRQNKTLRSGLHAYVLVDFVRNQWKSSNWTLDYLKRKIPFEWVDYYRDNMDEVGKKPFLRKFEHAVPQFQEKHDHPRYMQIRLGRKGWVKIAKDLQPKPLPEIFWDDDEWISKCMVDKDGKVDKKAIDNFFTTNQWKFLLIGEKGTSMFFHQDGTASSSWQAQLVGRKKWTLCPNSESHLLSVHLNTFDPDYRRFPGFEKALCQQVTVSPGELLYYPGYWWHHTYQLDTPSISYTGALVGVEADRTDLARGMRKPHDSFLRDLQGKCEKCWRKGKEERLCDDISEKWPGAAPPPLRRICDTYLSKCHEIWDEHARNLHLSAKGEEL